MPYDLLDREGQVEALQGRHPDEELRLRQYVRAQADALIAQYKIDEALRTAVNRKYGEIQSAISWLEGFQGGCAGRLPLAFDGAHAALVDALAYLDCYKRATFVGGKPVGA